MIDQPLELTFPVETDAEGIVDGRKLAGELVRTAINSLAPYAEGCPICTYKLFSSIAFDMVEEVNRTGTFEASVYRPGLPWCDEALERHLAAAKASTDGIARQQGASSPPGAWRRGSELGEPPRLLPARHFACCAVGCVPPEVGCAHDP